MEKFQNKYRIPSARLQNWDYGSNGRYFVTICTADMQYHFGEVHDREMHLSESGILANMYWLQIPEKFPFVVLGEFVVMPNHMHGIIIIDGGISVGQDDGGNGGGCGGGNGGNGVGYGDVDGYGNGDGGLGGFGGLGGLGGRDAINRVSTGPTTQPATATGPTTQPATATATGPATTTATQPGPATQPATQPAMATQPQSPTKPPTQHQPGGITGDKNPMLYDNLSRAIRWYKGRVAFEIHKINAGFAWQSRFHDHIIRDDKSFDRITNYIKNNPAKWSDDKFYNA